jgi:hypothetical protein
VRTDLQTGRACALTSFGRSGEPCSQACICYFRNGNLSRSVSNQHFSWHKKYQTDKIKFKGPVSLLI